MNPLPGKCPVCNNNLSVTRLQCGQCGTAIEGLFGLGRFQALTPDQLKFAEIFIKCRGKIKDVQDELDISYPTVVARLNELVRAMGYEVDDRAMSEVDQYEYYEAQVLNPEGGAPQAPRPPFPPTPPAPFVPAPPVGPRPPFPPTPPASPRLSPEKRQEVLDDLAVGKISAAEAMKRLQGQ